MANYTNTPGKLVPGLHNTISITGAQGSTANPWQNLTTGSISLSDLDWGNDTHVKKYQVLEIEEDLLALSCAWNRIRKSRIANPDQPYKSFEKLIDKNLFKEVQQFDYDTASKIRDYYSKKIMVWKLTDHKLSTFREDMNTFIHSNGRVFREDMQPLAYRLPEFYDYDVEMDQLISEHSSKVERTVSTRTLALQKTFNVGKKYNKRKEYWFTDEFDGLVCISLASDNPLLSLLDLCTDKQLKIKSNFSVKLRDNTEYLTPNKFKFV